MAASEQSEAASILLPLMICCNCSSDNGILASGSSILVGLNTSGNESTVLGKEGTEDEGADSGELDEDVDGGTGGVLKGIADGVASDGGSVGGGSLEDLLETVTLVDVKLASLNVLLGVIPSATGVGGGEGNLDSGDNAASEDSVGALVAEEGTSDEG